MNNGRFATSLHILSLLGIFPEELRSSEWLAGSININPVLVRKELINLRNAGLVASKEGKNGGSYLAKPAHKILLSEVFKAVQQEFLLGRTINTPNPDCRVGKQINKHLDKLNAQATNALIQQLGKQTLADFMKQFK